MSVFEPAKLNIKLWSMVPPKIKAVSTIHSMEKGMTTHSSILPWRIPWTEEPGELQSIGSQTVRHD